MIWYRKVCNLVQVIRNVYFFLLKWTEIFRGGEGCLREGKKTTTCIFVDFRPCRGIFFRIQEASEVGNVLRDNLGKTLRSVPSTPM